MKRLLALLALLLIPTAVLAQHCFPEVSPRCTEPPLVQTLTAGQTIAANACGTIKRITAAGTITTSTTETFDNPGYAGCVMQVCNLVGSNNITLDNNAGTLLPGDGDLVLGAGACIEAFFDGLVWRVESTGGVVQSGDLKHQRVTTGSCAATGCDVTLTWATPFGNADYTVTCTTEDATAGNENGLQVERVSAKSATAVTVKIVNLNAGAVTGTLDCIALHD